MNDIENPIDGKSISRRQFVYTTIASLLSLNALSLNDGSVEAAGSNMKVLTARMIGGEYMSIDGLMEEMHYPSIKSHRGLYLPQFHKIQKFGLDNYELRIPFFLIDAAKTNNIEITSNVVNNNLQAVSGVGRPDYGVNLDYDYIKQIQDLYKSVDRATAEHTLVLLFSNDLDYLGKYMNVLPIPTAFYNPHFPFNRFSTDFQFVSSSMRQTKRGDLKDNVIIKSNGRVDLTFPRQDSANQIVG